MKQPTTYYQVKASHKRFVVNQGGSRSGKTYSILQLLIEWCYLNQKAGWVITICRKSFPALRGSVMRDFFEILENENYYDPERHNKTESTYNLFGNTVEFISLDQPQKVRGRKRQLLFINEANEISWEDFHQLNIRTEEKVILDFNPSEEFWVFDKLIPRDDCDYFKTNYKDNPHIPEAVRAEIERLKEVDDYYWQVYGLGELSVNKGAIFSNWKQCDKVPEAAKFLGNGLDFGFSNDPTAFIEMYRFDGALYVNELLYETGLTNTDINDRASALIDIRGLTIADSAEPKSIEELKRLGWNIKPVSKGPDSIRQGIDILKRQPVYFTLKSANIEKERRLYKWQEDKSGNFSNKPVDKFNHSIDAIRYIAMEVIGAPPKRIHGFV